MSCFQYKKIMEYNPFVSLYYLKKTILIYERVFGYYPNREEQDFHSNSEAEFAELVEKIQSELETEIRSAELSAEDVAFLYEQSATDFIDLAEHCDFELITEKHHHRKFFNEIENEAIVETLLSEVCRLWNIDAEGEFFVELYDFNDRPIFFATREDLENFVKNFDVAPYVAFQTINGKCEELWSE